MSNQDIYDSHAHAAFFGMSVGKDALLENAAAYCRAVGVCGTHLLVGCAGHPAEVLALAEVLLLKCVYPGLFSVSGGFSYAYPKLACDAAGLRKQIERMQGAGFDGLKMLEGLPSVRQRLRIPLDDPRFDQAFSLMEETGYHITAHVNGPEPFEYATPGGKSVHIGSVGLDFKEMQYREIEHLLARHPETNITLAHCYFLGNDRQRLGDFLDRHPSTSFDIAPSGEMYLSFAADLDSWRDFFIRYQDRILFGSDNGLWPPDGPNHEAAAKQISILRRCFSTDDVFYVERRHPYWEGHEVAGLALPEDVLAKLFKENYLRLRGPVRDVSPAQALCYCEHLEQSVRGTAEFPQANATELQDIIAHFASLA